MMRRDNVVVSEVPDLHRAAAEWIGAILASVLRRGRCGVALSGGRTPLPVYVLLGRQPLVERIDWSRLHVYFADERAVPPDDVESNFGMARDALLAHVPVPADQIHRMEGECEDLDVASWNYEKQLPDVLDLLILGLGSDGHTASIFPGSDALRETERRVMAVVGPNPPPRRLTITPPVIRSAKQIVVIATGADKAAAVARALDGTDLPLELPIQLAKRGAWFLDAAAASLLK